MRRKKSECLNCERRHFVRRWARTNVNLCADCYRVWLEKIGNNWWWLRASSKNYHQNMSEADESVFEWIKQEKIKRTIDVWANK